jgi:HlyD family secretion protein
MRARTRRWAEFLLSLFLAGSIAGCRGTVRAAEAEIPTASVQQSDVQLKIFTSGELRTTRSSPLAAPPIAGGSLQIIQLARSGSAIRAGEVALEFDPSQQEYNVAQNRSDLQQAEQEIVKAKADAAVQAAEDQTALLKAKYYVRRTELEVSKNELVSQIDAQKNLLALEQAKRALAQLQEDVKSHSASNQAALALSQEKRNKAQLAMQQAERNIQNMRVKSPIDGLVVVRGNQNSTGGFFFGGMTLPEFQVGDQVNPGDMVAEVIDINQLEVAAKVSESDRAMLKNGESTEFRFEALPGESYSGKLQSVSGTSGREWWGDSSQRKFDITMHLDRTDQRLRPGFAADVVILGDRVSRALSIPREAVFERDGKTLVYVKRGRGFQQQEVKIQSYSEGKAILDGLPVGTVIALVNPESKAERKSKSGTTPSQALAPGAK